VVFYTPNSKYEPVRNALIAFPEDMLFFLVIFISFRFLKFCERKFLYFKILCSVDHLITIIVNKQLDAQPLFFYLFIPILYMFRATKCQSSGESTVSIRTLVYVTVCRWICDFIPILYMFRATKCWSSEQSTVSVRPLVYVTVCRWICDFIPILYMFRATKCWSSEQLTVSVRPLVYVTVCRWICDFIPILYIFRATSADHQNSQLYQYDLWYMSLCVGGFVILFQFSTCFEQPSTDHQNSQLYQYDLWYMSLCVGGFVILFQFSTCFEQPSADHQKSQL